MRGKRKKDWEKLGYILEEEGWKNQKYHVQMNEREGIQMREWKRLKAKCNPKFLLSNINFQKNIKYK